MSHLAFPAYLSRVFSERFLLDSLITFLEARPVSCFNGTRARKGSFPKPVLVSPLIIPFQNDLRACFTATHRATRTLLFPVSRPNEMAKVGATFLRRLSR